ncbi:uncharacterized protein AMSG_00158 [Thecamonas trahens ATCC 50062]|uniref:RRM domain-containing protein n=1 Tax=Thecamonas trahens ATCC 50062 TaxID=461836 RepID=A0A0L0D0Y5_THETB|nr:hypothetical protein AMSG_00158 [Thecamonas trahens ATCC 50062]KNC46039.1 hypothetical protein AMSG_00158 [Thecamonas trahens ATCC 50062]|eukprot:XP_013763019.1 hypothetical protein AMSG_00158 [Thecamonas trahens ATCC 50062]
MLVPHVNAMSSGISFRALPQASLRQVVRSCRRAEAKAAALAGPASRAKRLLFDLTREIRAMLDPLLDADEALRAEVSRTAAALDDWRAVLTPDAYSRAEAAVLQRLLHALPGKHTTAHAHLTSGKALREREKCTVVDAVTPDLVRALLKTGARRVAQLELALSRLEDESADALRQMEDELDAQQDKAQRGAARQDSIAAAHYEAEMDELRAALSRASNEREVTASRLADAERYIATLEKTCADQVDQLTALQSHATQLAGELAGIERSHATVDGKYARAVIANDEMRSKLVEYEGIMCDVEAELLTPAPAPVLGPALHPGPASSLPSHPEQPFTGHRHVADVPHRLHEQSLEHAANSVSFDIAPPPEVAVEAQRQAAANEVSGSQAPVVYRGSASAMSTPYQEATPRPVSPPQARADTAATEILHRGSASSLSPTPAVVESATSPNRTPAARIAAANAQVAAVMSFEVATPGQSGLASGSSSRFDVPKATSVSAVLKRLQEADRILTVPEEAAHRAAAQLDDDEHRRAGAAPAVPVYRDIAAALGVKLPPPRHPGRLATGRSPRIGPATTFAEYEARRQGQHASPRTPSSALRPRSISITEDRTSRAVYVGNVSAGATEKAVRDFFAFCGAMDQFHLEPVDGGDGVQHAVVVFAAPSAWQTALLLTNARIGDSAIAVTAYQAAFPDAAPAETEPADPPPTDASSPADEAPPAGDSQPGTSVAQEAKSKTAIMAELTASGYMLGANTLGRARAFDEEHFNLGLRMQLGVEMAKEKVAKVDKALGISSTVGAATQTASAAAKAVDSKLGVSSTVSKAADVTVGAASAVGQTAMAVPGVRSGVDLLVGVTQAIGATMTSYSAATANEVARRRSAANPAAGVTSTNTDANDDDDDNDNDDNGPPPPSQAIYG